jgi:hypothetical protein
VRFETFGGADRTLLFVLGWGSEPDHEGVDWLLGRLADAYAVHVAVLPPRLTDFESDYRRPLERYVTGRNVDAVLAQGAGGLVAAFLPIDARRVYLSPFWGFSLRGYAGLVFPLVRRLPFATRILPAVMDAESLGDLKPTAEAAASRESVSPSFVREVYRAQSSLPSFRRGSTVFCSLSDPNVSLRTIGERAPAAAVRLYDGGHEFFSSSGREAVVDDVSAALRAGPAAVEGPDLAGHDGLG